ncbi:MAG TPA: hypothetical protein VF409_10835 [Sphingomonas sp.]
MIRAVFVAIAFFAGALILWPAGAPAERYSLCRTDGYLHRFDPRLLPQDCEVIATAQINWRGGHATLRAIRPSSTAMPDEGQAAADVRDAALRIGAAMDRMGGSLQLDDVTVLFSSYASPPTASGDEVLVKGAYIAAAGRPYADECAVGYFKAGRAHDSNDLIFTLAHEIYHCIQYKTWPTSREDGWLIEGTAEYFGYLAKPDFGAGFIPQFDAHIQRHALNEMVYPAVVYFLWLGDKDGPLAVRAFIPAYDLDMESVIPADTWLRFGQDYFDGNIKMPDPRLPLPSTPQVTTTRSISATTRIASPAYPPYSLNEEIWSFAANKRFDLTYAPRPADTRITWRKDQGGGWVEPLTTLSTCGNEQRYRVLYVSTNSFGYGDTNIRVQPSGGTCRCPIGTWEETSDSLKHYFEQSAVPGSTPPKYVSGGRRLTLNADHTGSFSYESVVTETGQLPSAWLRQTKTGGTHFTWKVVDGNLLTVLQPGNNLLNLYNEMRFGTGMRTENRRGGAQSIGHSFFCDGAGLHLRQLPRGPSMIPGLQTNFNVDMDFAPAG